MLSVLPTVAFTARMLVKSTMMIIRPHLLLQDKKADKDKKRKNNRMTEISLESSSSHSENSSSSDDSFEDDNSNKSHKFQLSLNLRGTNGSFLVK